MWKLTKGWKVKVGNTEYKVNKGFETDFASVPRFAWFLVSPTGGHYRQPAVLHDWMYVDAIETKAYADKVFLEFMKKMGVPYIKRYLMYYAVKFFGSGNYEV